MKTHGTRRLLISISISLIIFVVVGETGLRFLPEKYTETYVHYDERNLCYQHDEKYGWFPRKSVQYAYTGSRTIHIRNNSQGFRDDEFSEDGRPRVLFLGDSFVWGYDVEESERFTERLQERAPEWNIVNLGVSGYGTDQEYLLLMEYLGRFKPKAVVLVMAKNDHQDNISSERYSGYYKPFFEIAEDGRLVLKGVPVPKSLNFYYSQYPFLYRSYIMRAAFKIYGEMFLPPVEVVPNPALRLLENMQLSLGRIGAALYVGLVDDMFYEELSRFLEGRHIGYLDLRTDYRFPSYGEHWTPKGHEVVSDRIYAFLKNRMEK